MHSSFPQNTGDWSALHHLLKHKFLVCVCTAPVSCMKFWQGWVGLWATWPRERCPCLLQGGWNWMILNIPSSPTHSMIKKPPWLKPKIKDTRSKKQPNQNPTKQWNTHFITLKILDLGFIFQALIRKWMTCENRIYGSTLQIQINIQAKNYWCLILLLDVTFSDFNALNHFLA